MKHDGTSIPELVGMYLGKNMKTVMVGVSIILLILVGTVFITSPAGLLTSMTGINKNIWLVLIIVYYIIATVLPGDKVIGKLYPIFGAALLLMAAGLFGAMIIGQFNGSMHMAELTLENLHPAGDAVFPFLFTTIACGAISGFHATQSPMMARCIQRESETRRVFFGSMIVEGIVALIWCAVTIAFFGDSASIAAAGEPAQIVNTISSALLGPVGAVLAVLGVVACPITSGDTAFRSARLTIADAFKIKQDGLKSRFMLAIPLFAVGVGLTQIDFNVIWRYFAWSNQTLAMIFLWTGAAYLLVNKKNFWIAVVPAIFMSYVSVAYILQAKIGLNLNPTISNIVAVIVAIAFLIAFMMRVKKEKSKVEKTEKAS